MMERGNALPLANGWQFARRRLMGGAAVEIEGLKDINLPARRRMGCTVETVSWRTRVFAPNARAMERILDRWPLAARFSATTPSPRCPPQYILPAGWRPLPPHPKEITPLGAQTLPDEPNYCFLPGPRCRG